MQGCPIFGAEIIPFEPDADNAAVGIKYKKTAVIVARLFAGRYRPFLSNTKTDFRMKRISLWAVTIFLSANLSAQAELSQGAKLPPDTIPVLVPQVDVVTNRATKSSPVAFAEISAEELSECNDGRDLPYLLTTTPSLVVNSDAGTGIGYTNLSIRGTDATRINVTSDGVPMNDAESHKLFWVNMPDYASALEDVQVQRGVGTSVAGAGAFGATISLRSERLDPKPYTELALGGGSFGTLSQRVKVGSGLVGGRWIFSARLSDIHSDGYIERARADLQSWGFDAGYFKGGTSLRFQIFGGEELTYHAWDGVDRAMMEINRRYNPCGEITDESGAVVGYYDNQIDLYRQTNYRLMLAQKLSSRFDLNLTLHYTDGYGYYEEYKNDRSLVEYGLQPFVGPSGEVDESDLIRRKVLDNGMGGALFALGYHTDHLSATLGGGYYHYSNDHYGNVIWVKNYIGPLSPAHRYYSNVGVKDDANLYLRADWQISPQLMAYADVQWRYIGYTISGENDKWDWSAGAPQMLDVDSRYHFFNPKFGLSWQLSERNRLYLSWATAGKEPTRNNYTDAKSDRQPRPERLYDLEAGWNYSAQGLSLGVNLYDMRYRDQLILTGEVNEIGELLADNVAESYRRGVELVASWQALPELRVSANATLSSNKIVDYVAWVDSYDEDWNYSQVAEELGTTEISFSPSVLAGSAIEWRRGGLSATLQTNYVGRQYLSNANIEALALDPYCISSLRLGYTFRPARMASVTLSATIGNLFDEEYSSGGWSYSCYEQGVRSDSVGYYPQAGRNFMFGAVVRF